MRSPAHVQTVRARRLSGTYARNVAAEADHAGTPLIGSRVAVAEPLTLKRVFNKFVACRLCLHVYPVVCACAFYLYYVRPCVLFPACVPGQHAG